MLEKKTLLNRILVGGVVGIILIGMVILDALFTNYVNSGEPNKIISGRAINSAIISVLIFLSVIEMRRALGKERVPDNFSWLLWAYGIGLGPAYMLFGFNGILFFTLLVFAAAAVTALKMNRADCLMNVAFMLVYPGLFMASLLYINRCASTQIISETSALFPYIENDIWSIIGPITGAKRISYLLPYNAIGLALVFAVSSLTDVFAFFVGSIFGKHKLCPEISPKKTIEGAIGGVFGGLIGAALVFFLFDYFHVFGVQNGLGMQGLSDFNMFLAYFLIGLIGSCMTQIGDLLASMVKRGCGIKDYSRLLGAHGGIMDRFDGIMMNAAFVAVVYMFII